ncbi:MAG: dihydroorotate dehydrogenase electron transfer subunit [Candidatus Diapherotrites archaeon]|uniref:Dihydroorotate dehydrogenase electron transfer subunit n=1 Tax=Candidatus Iainarchaeum sp. TaxID=3101447 RepID=A0A2D6LPP9_9ARCH|nr:dihydroorotate dehydrogenase electron transfer subunit [Candidatus Diapherotrites archaeon]|tara:strand:- start:574 stop:1404 length:831 start_codon:yes stop_codon:yes gene_type:complete
MSKCNWPSETKTRMVEIEKIREEFPGNKTFFMKEELEFEPGQFAMVWLPGEDEKPIALVPNGKKYCLNIEGKGGATKKMLKLKKGQKLGIRGPYGKAFALKGIKKACIVAGGVGIDSIILLAQKLKEHNAKVKIILGGRNKERIIFEKELKKTGEVYITTDDGSYGEKGFNVQVLERLLKKEKFDLVYACGPEIMTINALKVAKKYKANFEGSLERYMKCGIGICGQCVIDDKLVCKDGPVFSEKELSKMKEFGKSAYLKSGKKVSLKDYYAWREE